MAKPFAYLQGMEPADDAPVMDNPARLYCPPCRADGRQVCEDPGYCGNLRPMKPLLTPPDAIAAPKATNPPPVRLDTSQGEKKLVSVQVRPDNVFPERIMGRRTTITQLPDGEEMDYDWFWENIGAGLPE